MIPALTTAARRPVWCARRWRFEPTEPVPFAQPESLSDRVIGFVMAAERRLWESMEDPITMTVGAVVAVLAVLIH